MYCIVKCPYCQNLQGAQYPIKNTRCRVCSKTLDLKKIDPLGIFDDRDTMKKNLLSLKWDKETPIEEFEESVKKGAIGQKNPSSGSRDRLRTMILEEAGTNAFTEEIVQIIGERGYSREDVENCMEELKRKGLLYSPRFGKVKRVDRD